MFGFEYQVRCSKPPGGSIGIGMSYIWEAQQWPLGEGHEFLWEVEQNFRMSRLCEPISHLVIRKDAAGPA